MHRLSHSPLEIKSSTIIPTDILATKTPSLVESIFIGTFESTEIPFSLHMNFEAPVSEWHVIVMGENFMGVVDLFRDIYIKIPNDRQHNAFHVIKSSIFFTIHHWYGVITKGVKHITKHLHYGNDVLYEHLFKSLTEFESNSFFNIDAAAQIHKYQVNIMNFNNRY
jgi:hypothetical protein